MAIKIIQNKNLLLKISCLCFSIFEYLKKKQNIDIFRPLNNNKKINKFNSYFTGYFAKASKTVERKKSFYDHEELTFELSERLILYLYSIG